MTSAQSPPPASPPPDVVGQAIEDAARFATFLTAIRIEAIALGIKPGTLDRALAGLAHDPEIAALNANQTEHVRTAGEYLAIVVSEARITNGREMLARHGDLLARIEARFGVDRHVLLAIWGIESSFGANLGERAIVRSLTTLAALDQRRAAFWRGELIAALRLLDRGDAPREDWRGSWAGASGHTQFMPTTLARHGVDFDGDGRVDMWNGPVDALASAAAYLKASGWIAGEPAALEVALPEGFDHAFATPGEVRTRAEWTAAGVRFLDERAAAGQRGAILLPAGHAGPAFFVGANFRAILRYNNAAAYALAVAHLADRIAGGGALLAAWPSGDRALSRAEREELQRLLQAAGHDVGTVDGIIGTQTRAAIRAVQRTLGGPADGHPNGALLEALRSRAR